MSGASSLSPLRARLSTRENAIRVAQRMMQAGIAVMVAPGDAMQPWRVIERADLTASEVAHHAAAHADFRELPVTLAYRVRGNPDRGQEKRGSVLSAKSFARGVPPCPIATS